MAKKKVVRTRRRERKNVVQGQAHIQSTFNNTIISITDIDGNVISWGSAGAQGFKGSRKSTPFAAQQTAETTAKKALEHGIMTRALPFVEVNAFSPPLCITKAEIDEAVERYGNALDAATPDLARLAG